MTTTIFCFAIDLIGESVEAVCDRIVSAGISGITLAASYHEARDYLPHNPMARVHYGPAGTAFLTDIREYPDQLHPAPLLPVCEDRDLLAELIAQADKRLDVHVWAVYLHNDGPAGQHGSVRSAFGDEHQGLLCPADPVVRRYARALTRDLCRPGVQSISAEAMHGLPFEHGFHHERRFAPLTRLERFLLSLCFCTVCLNVPGMNDLARRIRTIVGTGADVADWTRMNVEASIPGLAECLLVREKQVATLADECADEAAVRGVTFSFLDVSAGIEGWASGKADGPLGVDVGWELGIDVSLLKETTRVIAVPYTRDPGRVKKEVEAYRNRVAGPLDVILRPMRPDVSNATEIANKIAIAREAGADRLAYYHYGMMTLEELDNLSQAQDIAIA